MGKKENSSALKLHADGNGGIYFDPEDILNDPEIQRKAEEFSAILREMSREKASNTDSAKETDE
ncbi:MAG: hypothetical protein OXE05_00625 [Chloroflexi bacterium]|nr:hypothetical protein [Chloroflexota bacterium]